MQGVVLSRFSDFPFTLFKVGCCSFHYRMLILLFAHFLFSFLLYSINKSSLSQSLPVGLFHRLVYSLRENLVKERILLLRATR